MTTYPELYNRVRHRLRLNADVVTNEDMRFLLSSIIDEISQARLQQLAVTVTIPQNSLGAGGPWRFDDLDPPLLEFIGLYHENDPSRIQSLANPDHQLYEPYYVVSNQSIRAYNLDENRPYTAKYLPVYQIKTDEDSATDMFFQRTMTMHENGLIRQTLEWQKASPEMIAPFDTQYKAAMNAAKKNINAVRGRLPRQ